MAEIDDLPSWSKSDESLPPLGESAAMAAARRSSRSDSASSGMALEDEPVRQDSRRRPPAFVAPVLVVLAGFVGGILLAAEFIDVGGSSAAVEAGEQNETVEQAAPVEQASPAGSGAAVADGVASDDSVLDATLLDPDGPAATGSQTAASDTAESDAAASEPGEAETSTRPGRALLPGEEYEVRYSQGRLYLSGALPDLATEEVILERASAIVGPDNITTDHTFDPALEIDPNSEVPIIVDDVVYFEVGSSTIAPEFYPLVELGSLLLQLNPQASITVKTYTDASGSAEDNLRLSAERAQSIMDYHLFLGGNPDQLFLDPRGEEGAEEGASAEMAAEQRRAEFTLNGFLNGLFDQ